ncbi:hypothetical protein D3C84_526940 [compost metagenome]
MVSFALGGDFRSGFVSGAMGTLGGNMASSAIIGGVSSKITGGSFAEGAVISAISYTYGRISNSNGAESAGLKKSLATIGGVVGKVWNLPNTMVGLVYGAVGYVGGLIVGTSPYVEFGGNEIRFRNILFMSAAMTHGNVVLYGTSTSPDSQNNLFWGTVGWTVGGEEGKHVIQGQILGPFYYPMHILGGVMSIFSNPHPGLVKPGEIDLWHRNNFMETGPMQGSVF